MHGNVTTGVGNSPLLTERLWASFASEAVRSVQLSLDMTDQDLADNIGCCAQTVANARNMSGQVAGRTLVNLLRVSPMALEGVLHHFGRRSVPIEARCNTDALVPASKAVHSLAVTKCPTSPGGAETTDDECLECEPEIDAAMEALASFKARCHAIRAQREKNRLRA